MHSLTVLWVWPHVTGRRLFQRRGGGDLDRSRQVASGEHAKAVRVGTLRSLSAAATLSLCLARVAVPMAWGTFASWRSANTSTLRTLFIVQCGAIGVGLSLGVLVVLKFFGGLVKRCGMVAPGTLMPWEGRSPRGRALVVWLQANTRSLRLVKLLAVFQPNVLNLLQSRVFGLSLTSVPLSALVSEWRWVWVGDALASVALDGSLLVVGVLRHRIMHQPLSLLHLSVCALHRAASATASPIPFLEAVWRDSFLFVGVVADFLIYGVCVQTLALVVNGLAVIVNCIQFTSALWCEPFGGEFELMSSERSTWSQSSASTLSLSPSPACCPNHTTFTLTVRVGVSGSDVCVLACCEGSGCATAPMQVPLFTPRSGMCSPHWGRRGAVLLHVT
jgi:hypothetical protein